MAGAFVEVDRVHHAPLKERLLMSRTMKVSVVLGSFQGAAHLDEQLASLAQQHRRPDELILTDDASTDETLTIAQAFAREAPFAVHVLTSEANHGLISNFERGMRAATGDLVFLCDQDDVWYPNKIASMVRHFEVDDDLLLAVCDADLVDAELRSVGTTLLELRRRARLPDDEHVLGCATAFRRALLDVALPTLRGHQGHDRSLHHIARAIGARMVIDVPLQAYRRHASNASELPSTVIDPRPADRLRRVLERPPATALEEDLVRTDALIERLRAIGAHPLSARPLDALLALLDEKREAMRARMALRRHRWLAKALGATRLWLRGGYVHFRGWRSYAKDLFR